jgi:hypothetical protein
MHMRDEIDPVMRRGPQHVLFRWKSNLWDRKRGAAFGWLFVVLKAKVWKSKRRVQSVLHVRLGSGDRGAVLSGGSGTGLIYPFSAKWMGGGVGVCMAGPHHH